MTFSRTVAAALFAVALGGCRSARGGAPPVAAPECACPSASSPAAAASIDPFAPVLVPGPDRPRGMHTKTLDDTAPVWSATAFRAPDTEHAQGTLLLATSQPARLIELDVATLEVVREQSLPASGTSARVAATTDGVVVVVNDSEDGEPVFVLDAELRLRATLKARVTASNVHAEGKLAVVGAQPRGDKASELTVVELPSGKVVGKRRIAGALADEWVPSAQVLIHHDRVFALVRDHQHYLLEAYAPDLGNRLAQARLTRQDGASGPHYGDGALAPAPNGVLVVRDGSLDRYDDDLELELPLKPGMSHFPYAPAIDPDSGRVLFATGDAATSLGSGHNDPVLAFRHDTWKWSSDGEVPLAYDEPVAAFFVGGRGVIVTKHPSVRVTVIEWGGRPPRPMTDLFGIH
jgi:hypothetical protein